jgi:hypothetical protein
MAATIRAPLCLGLPFRRFQYLVLDQQIIDRLALQFGPRDASRFGERGEQLELLGFQVDRLALHRSIWFAHVLTVHDRSCRVHSHSVT